MLYPSDVTDKQWKLIKGYFENGNYGNHSKHEKRELVNAVFYLTRTGCQWRQLPNNFPPPGKRYIAFLNAQKTKGFGKG